MPHVVVTRRPPSSDVLPRLEVAGDVWLWDGDEPIARDLLLEQVAGADGLYAWLRTGKR